MFLKYDLRKIKQVFNFQKISKGANDLGQNFRNMRRCNLYDCHGEVNHKN